MPFHRPVKSFRQLIPLNSLEYPTTALAKSSPFLSCSHSVFEAIPSHLRHNTVDQLGRSQRLGTSGGDIVTWAKAGGKGVEQVQGDFACDAYDRRVVFETNYE